MTSAWRLNREVIVPAVVLAELYRGSGRSQLVDAALSREVGVVVRSTDRQLARMVGGVLVASGRGSEYLADAHVVAVAVESGGGLILTGDPTDMVALSAPYANVVVEAL
ncbi:MAG: hypothetical protein R2754_16390 [Microthrixaceae bacterium]